MIEKAAAGVPSYPAFFLMGKYKLAISLSNGWDICTPSRIQCGEEVNKLGIWPISGH